MRKIAIIGGTGVQDPHSLKNFETKIIQTPFGPTQCYVGEKYGNQVAFIARHGIGHTVPPHKINYRANIWALKSLGTEEIFATTAVGSLNVSMKPGHFIVCNQLLDFTKNRITTFYNGETRLVAHVDFTNPYCSRLREKVITCLKRLDLQFHSTGCYVCTEGPRFETAAEVRMFSMLGGDLVGMTNMPESFLAREAEMCYVNCSIVTNPAAGLSATSLSHAEVIDVVETSSKHMADLIDMFIAYNDKVTNTCNCAHSMAEFGGFKLNGFV